MVIPLADCWYVNTNITCKMNRGEEEGGGGGKGRREGEGESGKEKRLLLCIRTYTIVTVRQAYTHSACTVRPHHNILVDDSWKPKHQRGKPWTSIYTI